MAVRITNQGAFDKAESALWHDGHIGGHEINMLGRENTTDLRVSQCLESQISYVPGS
jgi:hypothetical protein